MEVIITISKGYSIFKSLTANKQRILSSDYNQICREILLSLNDNLNKSEMQSESFTNAVDIIQKRLMFYLGNCSKNNISQEIILADKNILFRLSDYKELLERNVDTSSISRSKLEDTFPVPKKYSSLPVSIHKIIHD